MEKAYSCPTSIRFRGKTRFVLWVEPSKGENFLLKSDGRIFLAKNELALRHSLKKLRAPSVKWKWKTHIDLDEFFRKAAKLKAGTHSKPQTSNVLLTGWNFLEDIARTVDALEKRAIYQKKGPVWKMYDKLFHSSLSSAGGGREYWPIWSKAEIHAFKPALRELTEALKTKAPEIF